MAIRHRMVWPNNDKQYTSCSLLMLQSSFFLFKAHLHELQVLVLHLGSQPRHHIPQWGGTAAVPAGAERAALAGCNGEHWCA